MNHEGAASPFRRREKKKRERPDSRQNQGCRWDAERTHLRRRACGERREGPRRRMPPAPSTYTTTQSSPPRPRLPFSDCTPREYEKRSGFVGSDLAYSLRRGGPEMRNRAVSALRIGQPPRWNWRGNKLLVERASREPGKKN